MSLPVIWNLNSFFFFLYTIRVNIAPVIPVVQEISQIHFLLVIFKYNEIDNFILGILGENFLNEKTRFTEIEFFWWARMDLNHRPSDYESDALTN